MYKPDRGAIPAWLDKSCIQIEPVGSRITCSPPPMDTDQDWMCLLTPSMDLLSVTDLLEDEGWDSGGSGEHRVKWKSVKKGEHNLLITNSRSYFTLFMEATKEATQLNVMDKQGRIELFSKKFGSKSTKPLYAMPTWPLPANSTFGNVQGASLIQEILTALEGNDYDTVFMDEV